MVLTLLREKKANFEINTIFTKNFGQTIFLILPENTTTLTKTKVQLCMLK